MTKLRRSGGNLVLTLSEGEAALIESLCQQLVELLEADGLAPASDDPFAAWEAELGSNRLDTSDPVLARLFPPAYVDDAGADADFRRFTELDQRRGRVDQARLVLQALTADPVRHRVVIPGEGADAWLKTLTAIRLSLAVRLGIEDADDAAAAEALPEEDPRQWVYGVYAWLGYLLELLLAKL